MRRNLYRCIESPWKSKHVSRAKVKEYQGLDYAALHMKKLRPQKPQICSLVTLRYATRKMLVFLADSINSTAVVITEIAVHKPLQALTEGINQSERNRGSARMLDVEK
jgi:hypothetical protein